MTVDCLLFSIYRERLGASKISLDMPDGGTVKDAFDALCTAHFPEGAAMLPTTMFAVGMDYVTADHPLKDGDELALIPPVAGG